MNIKERLEALYTEYVNCRRCQLCDTRNKVVFGRGDEKDNFAIPNEDYKISVGKVFFVGEAPGVNEDEKGIPFIGRAGELFDSLMEDPEFPAFFVTNAVMCKPAGKEKPKAKHWNVCRERLLEEIRIVDPVVIVAMGEIAIKAVVGGTETSVNKARRKIHYIEIPGRTVPYIKPVICTYHPSMVQRKAQVNPGSVFEVLLKSLIEAKRVAKLWTFFGVRKDG